ncbi:MerR family transcriptional regulator [Rhodobacteraceae bacterium RKSG542]|uniref:MerR family transcriptional regulator n=1 Tax=Pseudovibrio flavus TaxID=2529854 RepID=UPI0012BCDB05|nr:helix-turn-helix domain-containing protein [Pseudovibrio flavus]MTI18640.1 MerR family transcriptional regulator [Pseudovibrio flavus]
MSHDYSIGDLAKRTGTSVQTIRHYEEKGLIAAPPRTEGGQRRYDETHLKQLTFIRHSRDMGFSLQKIQSLLQLSAEPGAFCASADNIAREHLAKIEDQIRRLTVLRDELKSVLEQACEGHVHDCRVLEALNTDHPALAATADKKQIGRK